MLEAAILIGLAGYRLASLLVNEAGPWNIFERLRDKIIPVGEVKGFLPGVLICIWCCSVWTTLASYILWLIEPTAVIIIAAMTIPMAVDKFINR